MDERTRWSFFLDNFKFTVVLIISIVVMGLVSIVTMPKEANPEVNVPVVIVSTAFPGASPEDVEELITNPLEEKFLALQDVEEVSSSSLRGVSSISVEFDPNADPTEKINDIKDAIDLVQGDLPADATDPLVQKVSFTDIPIVTLSLSGPFPVSQLKQYAEVLKDEIEQVSGVSKVTMTGGPERVFEVIVNKAQLDAVGLPITTVTTAIRNANADIPIGSVETSGENFTVKLEGRLEDAQEVASVPIAVVNGVPVLVRDVAVVKDTFETLSTISRLSLNGNPSRDAVALRVFKVSGGDILKIVDTVQDRASELRKDAFPESIVIKVTEDNAKYIRDDLGSLVRNGLGTIVIVGLIIFLFLGWREAVIAGLAIPLTFLITFGFLSAMGFTLNTLTLFSLILSLGILVDGAIVITEALHSFAAEGHSLREAAIKTINEFKLPLISGTLTTVFAFVPMLLTSGIMGEFIKSIPVTVSIVLVSSLFVALGLITTISVYMLGKKKKEDTRFKAQVVISDAMQSIRTWYAKTLGAYLRSPKKSKRLAWVLIGLFIFSFIMPIVGILKVNMFPPEDQDNFFIDIVMPIGTTLERTDEVARGLEDVFYDDERITSFVTTIGSTAFAGSAIQGGGASDGHVGSMIIELDEDRKQSSIDIIDEYQKLFAEKIDADVRVIQQGSGPGNSAPVEIRVSGPDLDELDAIALDIQRILESIDGTQSIDRSVKPSNGEFVFDIDRVKAQLYGISTAEVAGLLRNAVTGTKATVVQLNGDDVDVNVRYALDALNPDDTENKVSPNVVERITVTTRTGTVPLSNFVDATFSNSRSRIQHLDGDRIVRISAYNQAGVSPQHIFDKAGTKIEALGLPPEYVVAMGGEREDIQQSYMDMFRAFFLAIFMIAALLVWQFKSYRQPFFIMVTIPLALIGVFTGLALVNQPLTFPGIIGVVALAGIVVNNAIILIDRININRREGMLKIHAVEEAALSRLQPILLTTVTTVAGVAPLALTESIWGPLSYSIIFGLIFSTVLTLIVVPLLYNKYGEDHVV